MANLILHYKDGKRRYFDLTGSRIDLNNNLTLVMNAINEDNDAFVDFSSLKSIGSNSKDLLYMISAFLDDNDYKYSTSGNGQFGLIDFLDG